MAVQTYSDEQRHQALLKANDVRLAMVLIKQNIAALKHREGCELVANMLEQPSGHVPAMRLGALLLSVRGVGGVSVTRWLASRPMDGLPLGVSSADRKVRDLSERQRLILARLVRLTVHGSREDGR